MALSTRGKNQDRAGADFQLPDGHRTYGHSGTDVQCPQEKINEIRRELEMLLESGIERLSPTQLQLAGYRFHETIIAFSNNPFFEISLRNVNRMRRLMDYRIMDDRNRYYAEVKDHMRILAMIEAGQRIEASYTMKQHLSVALDNKKCAGSAKKVNPCQKNRPTQ